MTNSFNSKLKKGIFPDVLESKKLILRSMTLKDTSFIYEHFSDADVNRYLVDEEPCANQIEALEVIQWANNPNDLSCYRWIIQMKEDQLPIGTCGFHNWDRTNNKVEIGYDLMKSRWRQGISLEAVSTMLDFSFEDMNINRVEAFVHCDNLASARLLEKLGFKLEGLIRDRYLFRGNYYDHYGYSLLKMDR